MFELTPDLVAELQTMDTPTVCNALELLVPRRRGHGYTVEPLVCTRPELGPLVGIARTATIRSAHPGDLSAEEALALSDATSDGKGERETWPRHGASVPTAHGDRAGAGPGHLRSASSPVEPG
jgi:hypothetical protein